jgi:GNAT superfamily N-acetyltransferase
MNRLVGGQPRGLFVDGRLSGAMLLEPPAPKGPGALLRLLFAALRFVPVAVRLGGRSSSLLNEYFRLTRAAAPSNYHYLTQVGVRPELHGRGYGRWLVKDALAAAQGDPTSAGVALDTENETNVPRYERWGFRETSVVKLGEIRAHAMQWDEAAPSP